MTYFLAIFRSQTQTYAFAQILRGYNIPVAVISTPKQAEVSCGLSVKIMSGSGVEFARKVLDTRQFPSFVGFYAVSENNFGLKQITKI